MFYEYRAPDNSLHYFQTFDSRPPIDKDVPDGYVFTREVETIPVALDDAKAKKSDSILAACQDQIYSGFDSDALGITHHYPAKDLDQANLSASVLSSLLPSVGDGWTTLFLCADAGGVWAYRPHTAAQIQQVGTDVKNGILSNLIKNVGLQTAITSAADQAALDAINW